MTVSFRKEEGKEEEHIVGRMVINMLDNGNMIKWMEKERLLVKVVIIG
jgi:hypothetical protein